MGPRVGHDLCISDAVESPKLSSLRASDLVEIGYVQREIAGKIITCLSIIRCSILQ